MDLIFLALESPLFPGALLALFFAMAARALTQGPEVALDTPRAYRTPTPRLAQPCPMPEATPEAPVRLRSATSEAVSTASYSSAHENEAPAICSESDSESIASDMPIQWL